MNMEILTREFTVAEFIDFIKEHFTNNKLADTILDLNLDPNELIELPEINAILAECDIELNEQNCELPELQFVSLAA